MAKQTEKWVDVNIESPKDFQEVLVLLMNGEIFNATYCDDIGVTRYTSPYFKFNKGCKITHWQPLPNPPKQ
jgi:hypothetical protein